MFRKLLDQGQAGDNIGALIRGVNRDGVERGQILCKPGTVKPHKKFKAEAYILTKEEGGRHTPFFTNYRPQFYFRTTDVTGIVTLPEGTEMVMPGDNVTVDVELIVPIAMGRKAALRYPRRRPYRRRRHRCLDHRVIDLPQGKLESPAGNGGAFCIGGFVGEATHKLALLPRGGAVRCLPTPQRHLKGCAKPRTEQVAQSRGRSKGYSSVGRAAVSKTAGRGFEPLCPCHFRKDDGFDRFVRLGADPFMASKTNPFAFLQQVRAETAKVVWPSRPSKLLGDENGGTLVYRPRVFEFEKKVAEDIENKARQKGLEHLFEKILVPTEKVVEVRRGRKVDSERKFFPGYVLVRANLTDEAYHLIKNTPKVTGFLGSDNKPVPIPDYEADRILVRSRRVSSVRSRPSPSRSGSRFASPTVRSLRSTALCRMSTKSARASRSKFRSSVVRRRSSLNTVRSRRSDRQRDRLGPVSAWEDDDLKPGHSDAPRNRSRRIFRQWAG
ncbi:hypothetical protein Lal_00015443 [Lupinus albus]|nr:hypothetical protein Lal_00015443 [Lupinus albus]